MHIAFETLWIKCFFAPAGLSCHWGFAISMWEGKRLPLPVLKSLERLGKWFELKLPNWYILFQFLKIRLESKEKYFVRPMKKSENKVDQQCVN